MRKTYSGEFKAKAVREILKEEKFILQVASELEVHPNQLIKGKKEAVESLPEVLEGCRRKGDKEKEALKNQIQELYFVYAYMIFIIKVVMFPVYRTAFPANTFSAVLKYLPASCPIHRDNNQRSLGSFLTGRSKRNNLCFANKFQFSTAKPL